MSNDHLIFNARRRFSLGAAGLCAAPFISACSNLAATAKSLHVGALFAGQVDDRGFMEAGWRGLERARTELGVKTTYIDGVQPKKNCWPQHSSSWPSRAQIWWWRMAGKTMRHVLRWQRGFPK
ncbi:hypothetical protein LP414_22480 [Polaromonas sp. P1(28)-13]|nr:hypothetical protein LP414_22480 [Polaromonas sp. P1(28)-13]